MNKLIIKAFTLIELLVVIAIIGILSGLIVVGMGSMTNNANTAKGQVFSNSLRNSLMMNMVSEWRFDGPTSDGSAATVNDVLDTWSKINNGTLSANPPVVRTGSNCLSGSCLQFDGSAASGSYNYADFGSNSSLSMGTGDATASLWVRFDNAIASDYETLIVCGANGSGVGYPGYRLFRYNGTSRLYGYFSDGTASYIAGYLSPVGSLTSGTWYNIVIVMTRNATMQIYINGIKQTSSLDITPQQGSISNYSSMKIGAQTVSGYHLGGRMDEVRVFSAAMPISWIKDQYYIGLNKLYTNGGIGYDEYKERLNIVAER